MTVYLAIFIVYLLFKAQCLEESMNWKKWLKMTGEKALSLSGKPLKN
jgi:hypothetical protein